MSSDSVTTNQPSSSSITAILTLPKIQNEQNKKTQVSPAKTTSLFQTLSELQKGENRF
jgi:hypothetical protein